MYPVRLPLETTASPVAPPADSAASPVALPPDSAALPVASRPESVAHPVAPPLESAASAVAPPQSQQGEPPTSSEVEDGWSPSWRECSLSPLSSTWSVAAPDPGTWLKVAGSGETPSMGQMSTLRARASVERMGSPPVVNEPGQGSVTSPCMTAAEHTVDRPGRSVWLEHRPQTKSPGLTHPCFSDPVSAV